MPLTQVADTAMNELGTAARCAAAKIAPFEQQDRIAPRRGIDGHPRSRRTASNNDQVPRFAAIHGVAKEFSTIHADSALPEIRTRTHCSQCSRGVAAAPGLFHCGN